MPLVALPRAALNGDTVYVLDVLRDRLDDAERRLGAPIRVRSADSGHRAYERQKHYRDEFLAGRGNPASSPDVGPRSHMRGTGLDIYREDPTARAAMRAAGFLPDIAEPWHWNIPGYLTYPIIRDSPKDEDMPLNDHDLNRIRDIVRDEVDGRMKSGDVNYGPLFHRFQQHGDLRPAGWRPATRPDGTPVVADTKAYLKAILWFVGDMHRRLFGDSQKGQRADQGGPGGAIDQLTRHDPST